MMPYPPTRRRADKKQQLNALTSEFLKTTDASRLADLRKNILDEVTSCKFSESMLGITNIMIPLWSKDLASYITAITTDELNMECRALAERSLLGLLHLVDLSGLPE